MCTRDTIAGPLRHPFDQSPGSLVLMRCVDVDEQQTVRIVCREILRPNHFDPYPRRHYARLELAGLQPPADRRGRRGRVYRTERLVAARPARHDDLGLAWPHQPLEQRDAPAGEI